MKQWLISVSIRLAFCILVTYVGFLGSGPLALPFCAAIYGVVLIKPLFELIGAAFYAAKSAALHDLQGHYFTHRGIRLDVLEHADTFRWICTANVRKVLPGFPSDATLLKMYPSDVIPPSAESGARIKAERLHEMLMKSQNAEGIQFRNWLLREIIHPANRARE
jgi:hypothetical protein